jgi:hypothetical protein
VIDTGHEVGASLPLTASVMEMMQWLKDTDCAADDHSALVKYYEALQGPIYAVKSDFHSRLKRIIKTRRPLQAPRFYNPKGRGDTYAPAPILFPAAVYNGAAKNEKVSKYLFSKQ